MAIITNVSKRIWDNYHHTQHRAGHDWRTLVATPRSGETAEAFSHAQLAR